MKTKNILGILLLTIIISGCSNYLQQSSYLKPNNEAVLTVQVTDEHTAYTDCGMIFKGKFTGTGTVVDGKPNGSGIFEGYLDPSSTNIRGAGIISSFDSFQREDARLSVTIESDNWVNGYTEGFAKYRYTVVFDEVYDTGWSRGSGDTYEGETVRGCYNGWGILSTNSGTYEGEFIDDEIVVGTHTSGAGKEYEGEFRNFLPHGSGKTFFTLGLEDVTIEEMMHNIGDVRYEGDFIDGKFEGVGILNFLRGGRYEGEFVGGTFEGVGVLHRLDGNWYEGEFINGYSHGTGKSYDANGWMYYEGEFANGHQDGYGTRYRDDGTIVYQGYHENGMWNGHGILYRRNGDYFEGEFRDHNPAYGIWYFSDDGTRREGNWVDNRQHGYGSIEFPNGQRFEGEFIDGEYYYGTYSWSNGDYYTGHFPRRNEYNSYGEGTYHSGGITGSGIVRYNDEEILLFRFK